MNQETPAIRLLLILVPSYFLLGAVGLTLAIPPGYASPVFPAAGLALGCTLWFGRRALPGIWLGSAVLNLSQTVLSGALAPVTPVLVAGVATGATLQAWIGSIMVARQGPAWRDLEREQDVFGFLFRGGSLSCLVSATLGSSVLYGAGVISRAGMADTWWNWYVGDTLGVLVFAPLSLCLLNRDDPLWRERRRRIIMPLLATLILTLLAFHGVSRWEQDQITGRVRTDGAAIAKRIADRLITHREVLASLHHFISATPEFTFRQFEQFTRITLKDNPDIFALSYNDLVTLSERPPFERAMSRLSPLGPYRITERDGRKRLVPAAVRPEYVAVRYIVPLANNQPAVGFDINSEPLRRNAIERARTSGGMAVTAPLTLVQEQKERVGVLELMPVHGDGTSGGSARLLGFAVAVVKVDELIDIATRGMVPAGVRFEVRDPREPRGQNLFYRFAPPEAAGGPSSRTITWRTGLRMGDRDWELSLVASEWYLQQHRSWVPWGVAIAGLSFAALLQTLMLGMTGRTAVFQRQNEALKASEERYQRLFNDSPLPMWLYDADTGRFLMVNGRAVAHYGWPEEEFLRMSRFDLVPPGDLPADVPPERSAECRHLRRDGSVVDVLVSSSPAESGGRPARLEVVQDITQDKRNQAELFRKDQALLQSEKMASIGQLAAGVAHEINNPLGFISSNLRTMAGYMSQLRRYDQFLQNLNSSLPPEARVACTARRRELEVEYLLKDGSDLITESLAGTDRVTKIVRDLMNFSRTDAPVLEPVSLASCLESALTICYNELKYIASIRKEYDDETTVRCHPGQLNQVFLNLLVNAGHAVRPQGEIALRCWHDEHSVYASVSDTGQGIPEELRTRIFEPFFTTKEVGEGTGLGLSISYEIVKKHGGELVVESCEGKGTTFTVRLPRTPSNRT